MGDARARWATAWPILGGGGGKVPGWTCPVGPWGVVCEQGCEIATRSIVAVATLREPFVSAADWHADSAPPDELPPWADPDAKEWWALTDAVALRTPVPVPRGQLGLWTLDPETEAAVRREEAA